MKPAIAYGIMGSEFARDWEILTITTEKAGRRGRVYGRDEQGTATNSRPGDVFGRFATLAEAETARTAIRGLHRQHAPAIERAEEELARLQRARLTAIRRALEGVKVSPVAVVAA